LRTVPEVQELVGKEESRKLLSVKEQDGGIGVRSYLKSAFTKLMVAGEEAVSEAIAKIKSRLNAESKVNVFSE
jgi:mannose-6-phosphate isomerase